MNPRYEVVVGNIGSVYQGDSYQEASRNFKVYMRDSKEGYGRAAHEPVTTLRDGEIILEYVPPSAAQRAADRVTNVIQHYQKVFAGVLPDEDPSPLHAAAYLLADLRHFCALKGLDWNEVVEHAEGQVQQENA